MLFSRDDRSVVGRWWWSVDKLTLGAFILLIALGLLLVFTASPPVAETIGLSSNYFIRKHSILLIPAFITMISISLLPIRLLRRMALLLLLGSIAAVTITLFIGPDIKGATRWLSLPGFSIQPSEFLKPAYAIVIAALFAAQRTGQAVPGYLLGIVITLISLGLLLSQPDVGQSFLLLGIVSVQIFMVGVPYYIVILLILLLVGGLLGAYMMFDHVQSRIDRFLDPNVGDNFQISQAMQAFTSGGFWGKGPGEGVVKNRIPDSHSDFIFAVAGEEFGLLFCLLIIIIYIFIVIRSCYIFWGQENIFIMLAGMGLVTQFGLQAIINMASSLSLIPTKGMTLPFISYGGSSLLAIAITAGCILALSRRRLEVTW